MLIILVHLGSNAIVVHYVRIGAARRRAVAMLYVHTLAARGLEEPQNFQELLTESVGRVHFS